MNQREKEVQNMTETVEGSWYLNDSMDLIYSPDDSGWYIHDFRTGKESAIYATKKEACEAYTTYSLEWED